MKISRLNQLLLFSVVVALAVMLPQCLRPIQGNDKEEDHIVARQSLRHAKMLATAFLLYAADNDDRLPLAENWADAMMPYVRNEATFSTTWPRNSPTRFAFYEELSGVFAFQFENPGSIPLVFQSSSNDRNAHGGLEMVAWRGKMGCAVGFLDTSARFMPKSWPLESGVVEFAPTEDDTEAD